MKTAETRRKMKKSVEKAMKWVNASHEVGVVDKKVTALAMALSHYRDMEKTTSAFVTSIIGV